MKKIVDELNREHTEKERREIFDSPSKPILFQLRAKFDLWNKAEKSGVRRYFESKGIDHPDWISGCIYDAWKLSLSGIEIDEEEFLAKHAAIIRDSRAWNRTEEEEAELEQDPYPPPNQRNDPFVGLQSDVESEGKPRAKSPQTISIMIRGIDFAELRVKYREPLDTVLKESGVGRVGVEVGDSTGDVA